VDNATPDSNSGLQPVVRLPLEAIRRNPAQPRQRLDEAGLAELAASLREHGVLHPVLVRPLEGGTYELIAGERRWQAARRAGLATLPALVLHASPRRALELALVENVQRADLTALEEAEAYRGLMATLGLTQERLAERLGISRVAVTNRLRLLGLTPAARQALLDAHIAEGHARALLALHGEQQDEAVRAVMAGGLSVRQTERLVRRMAARPRRGCAGPARPPDPVVDALTESLRRVLGARVRARRQAGGLSVLIHFHAPEAAYQLVEALGGDEEGDEV
jgi:ParB family transcriptional regulator, chromosome partitioning protein